MSSFIPIILKEVKAYFNQLNLTNHKTSKIYMHLKYYYLIFYNLCTDFSSTLSLPLKHSKVKKIIRVKKLLTLVNLENSSFVENHEKLKAFLYVREFPKKINKFNPIIGTRVKIDNFNLPSHKIYITMRSDHSDVDHYVNYFF